MREDANSPLPVKENTMSEIASTCASGCGSDCASAGPNASVSAIAAGIELDCLLSPDVMNEERDVAATESATEALTGVVTGVTGVVSVTSAGALGEESKPSKPHKKKKKDTLDVIFDILERTIDVLLRSTPRLLEVLSSYLSAGGDAADPALRSLVSKSPEALAFLDSHVSKSPA